jgi:phosphomannomutase/phosphoglucomutase
VAGEGNGGVIFPAYRTNRDGAYTGARFLELLASEPASSVVAPYGGYENVRINVEFDTEAERQALIDAARETAEAQNGELTTIDGYRVDYGDAWVLARPSGTEPVMRIYAEAGDEARASELAETFADALEVAKSEAV